jgi:glycerol uptake facilitator-like aquaporin
VSSTLLRQLLAEFVGTALLVLIGVGSAVAGLKTGGPIVVALAFGLVLVALAYALGPVSGCHVNPAVTLGVLLSRGITLTEAAGYWVAQFAAASPAPPCSASWSAGSGTSPTRPARWAPTTTERRSASAERSSSRGC